jgi:hypothetical protein
MDDNTQRVYAKKGCAVFFKMLCVSQTRGKPTEISGGTLPSGPNMCIRLFVSLCVRYHFLKLVRAKRATRIRPRRCRISSLVKSGYLISYQNRGRNITSLENASNCSISS